MKEENEKNKVSYLIGLLWIVSFVLLPVVSTVLSMGFNIKHAHEHWGDSWDFHRLGLIKDNVLSTLASVLYNATLPICLTLLPFMLMGIMPPFAFLGFISGPVAIVASLLTIALVLCTSALLCQLMTSGGLQFIKDCGTDLFFNKKLKGLVLLGVLAIVIACSSLGVGLFTLPTIAGLSATASAVIITAGTLVAITVGYILLERFISTLTKLSVLWIVSWWPGLENRYEELSLDKPRRTPHRIGPRSTAVAEYTSSFGRLGLKLVALGVNQLIGDRMYDDEVTATGAMQYIISLKEVDWGTHLGMVHNADHTVQAFWQQTMDQEAKPPAPTLGGTITALFV